MADGDITAGIRAAAITQNTKSPLDTLQQVTTIGNALTYNKLQNQNILNAQQELLNQQQQLENAKLSYQKGNFDLASSALKEANANAASLLARDDLTGSVGHDAIVDLANNTLSNHPGSQHAQQAHDTFVSTIPPATQADGTPTPQSVYRTFLFQHLMAVADARDQLEAFRHPTIDLGDRMGPGPSIAEGIIKGQAGVPAIPKGMTPSEAGEPYSYPATQDDINAGRATELGQDVRTTKGAYQQLINAGAQPGQAARTGTKAGLTPTETAKIKSEQGLEEDAIKQGSQFAQNFQNEIGPSSRIHDMLQKGTIGPGTDKAAYTRNWLISNMPQWAQDMGITGDPEKAFLFDELKKNWAQKVQADPFAGKSVSALVNAETGGGSNDINTLAGDQIAEIDIAQKRMRLAAYAGWRQDGSKGSFTQYAENFQIKHDPRAFLTDMLTKEQRDTMLDGMKDTERDRYYASHDFVMDLNRKLNGGLLVRPGMPSPIPKASATP